MLNDKDKELLQKRGISLKTVEEQLAQFAKGFDFANIQRAATIGDGIEAIDDSRAQDLITTYQAEQAHKKVVKFIPASGAATRMFKQMFEFRNADAESQYAKKNEKPFVQFFDQFEDFAFAPQIKAKKPQTDAEKIRLMLDEDGLGYGQKPKGVITFHSYPDGALTAAEEHIVEGLNYAMSNGEINLHFTVSPQHLDLFKKALEPTKKRIEANNHVKVNVDFSFQKPETDTLAATMDNKPFRDDKGNLVFRPGGHGALIANLNELDADYVFIKNIDNVAQQHMLPTTTRYKQIIAGYAIEQKHLVDKLLTDLDKNTVDAIDNAVNYIRTALKIEIEHPTKEQIFSILNRPLRVCGMVKNLGEPGGGPFWVKGTDGNTTLQVVESAQIDVNDPQKDAIFKNGSHFNPVDLFCCITDHNGQKFDLPKFVDKEAGFISYKSLGGKDLKAMELPGLWNGAMANWLTFFVEVPVDTFNPVKTVMDLLRPQHQPSVG